MAEIAMTMGQGPDPTQQVWTVRKMLEWTQKHLQQCGSGTPRLDAEVMLAHVLGYQRIQLYTNFDTEPTDAERAHMRQLVLRRVKHEPVAYLVAHREFLGLDFHVTSDVLIPRPETETLVLEAIEAIREFATDHGTERPRVAEIGIGSGCVTVSLAVNLPSLRVTATDISEAAIVVAQQNVVRHGVSDRVEILAGSCFDPLPPDEKFDVIVSNPPYVTDSEYDSLQYEIRLHEPRTALTAGADGLDVVRAIVRDSPQRLNSGGSLLLEVDPAQTAAVKHLMLDAGFRDAKIISDLNGQSRVVIGKTA